MKAVLVVIALLIAAPFAQATSLKSCKPPREYREEHMKNSRVLNRMMNAKADAKTQEEADQLDAEISKLKDYIIDQINEAIACEKFSN